MVFKRPKGDKPDEVLCRQDPVGISAGDPSYDMNRDRHVVRAGIFGCSLTLMSSKEPQLSASLQLSGMAMKGFRGKPVTGSSPPGSRPESWPVELLPIWDSIGAKV